MANDRRVIDGSAIVEMDIMDDDDHSDYEVDLSSSKPVETDEQSSEKDFGDISKGQIASGVASYVWEEGRQRARKAFSIYGNIDILRPYFDVEPEVVRKRLIHSLIPRLPRSGTQQEKVPRELYGPTMLVFTLVALLLFQMKMSDHQIEEGTLMGTAIGLCFTYWLGVSGLLWSMSYVVNTRLSVLQILSLLGYALFGHCVTLFLSTAIHSNHSHVFFYMLWLIFGGLSTLRMVSILYSRTTGKSQRMIVCGLAATLHMLFLLYLHFAYHRIVEDLSYAMRDEAVNPQMMMKNDDLIDAKVQNDPLKAHDTGDHVVALVTESVKRVIREARPLVAEASNNTLAGDSKIMKAIVPENVNAVSDGNHMGEGIKSLGNGLKQMLVNVTAKAFIKGVDIA